jgi:glycosyltransferase 2 family protein
VDHAPLSSTRLSMNPILQRALRWVGSGLALIGIAFVTLRLHEHWGGLDLSQMTPSSWTSLIGLALLYGLANLLLALAWWHLLTQFGVQATRLWSIRVYGISQLAKYVPGNIFHLAGRQAIGMAAGASSGALAKSAFWELGLIAIAGILYGWLVLPLLASGFSSLLSIILLLGTAWFLAYLLRRFVGPQVAASFGWHMLFLAVTGGVFVTLLGVIVGSSELHMQTWLLIGGAYVVAWLAGLVTPGAPAGVGVRELVLLLLLKGFVADADLLMAVLLGRLVTVAGDSLFFVAAFLIPVKICVLERKYG